MKYKIKPEIQEKLDKGIPLTDDEKRSLKVATNAGTDLTLANVNSGIKSAFYSFVGSTSWLIGNVTPVVYFKKGKDFFNVVADVYNKKNEEEKERRELWRKAEVSSTSDKAIGDVLSYSDILVGGVGLAGKAGKGIKAAENIAQKTQKEGFFSRLFSRSKKGAEKAKKEADDLKSKPKEKTKENPDDYIEFTYNPGDAFGQKILDLGIATNNGLWGDNGDVAYYTQQLIDGGYLDGNGNVKLGVPIRLKKRK